jgi:hypothetical protein
MKDPNRLALRTLRAFMIGGLGMLLPLACGGCSLVARGGNDLQTAGSRITKAAVWVQNELGGSTTPPPQAGYSPAPSRAGSDASGQYSPSEQCSWENIKPNC